MTKERVAVLIPCYNEQNTIGNVIRDFQKHCPEADIYVYDNCSTDMTAKVAREAGAIVVYSPRKGKGNVIRHMLRTIDADVYVTVDGDGTYFAKDLPYLLYVRQINDCDMVIGDRLSSSYFVENKRPFHNIGNRLVCGLVNVLFHGNVSDVMTGYRVMSRRFCENMPLLATGFETETEITIHALRQKREIISVPVKYQDRPEGSKSKLHTFRDGYSIVRFIFAMKANIRRYGKG